MFQFKKILLATDFDEASEPSREQAASLAERHGAEFHVIRVYELLHKLYGWSGQPRIMESEQEVVQEIEQLARQQSALVRHPPGVKVVESVEHHASAPTAIARYAADHDIDLIVVGTHRRRAVTRWFLGSVAAEVVRAAPCPVLVVGPETSVDANFERILVATDFSESAKSAMQFAAKLASAQGAKLITMHVIEPLNLPPYYASKFSNAGRECAREALDEAIASAKLPVDTEVIVTAGTADERISGLARELATDLIVMGVHGLSQLDRFLIGSVTERVLRSAPCPVLAYREKCAGTV